MVKFCIEVLTLLKNGVNIVIVIFSAILQFGISSTMIFYLAPPELLAVSIGGIVAIMGISRVGGKYIRKYAAEQQKWTAEASQLAQERIHAIRTVRAFGHDQREIEQYSKLVRKVQAKTELEARANSTLWAMNPFMGNMLLVCILYSTVPYLQNGVISPGDVTALLLYGTFSGAALSLFGEFYTNMNKGESKFLGIIFLTRNFFSFLTQFLQFFNTKFWIF